MPARVGTHSEAAPNYLTQGRQVCTKFLHETLTNETLQTLMAEDMGALGLRSEVLCSL